MPTTSLFQEWFYWLFEINTFRHLLTAYFCRNCGRNASVLKSFLCSVSNVFLVLKAFITIWAMLYFVFMRWQMPFWTVIVFEFTFTYTIVITNPLCLNLEWFENAHGVWYARPHWGQRISWLCMDMSYMKIQVMSPSKYFWAIITFKWVVFYRSSLSFLTERFQTKHVFSEFNWFHWLISTWQMFNRSVRPFLVLRQNTCLSEISDLAEIRTMKLWRKVYLCLQIC